MPDDPQSNHPVEQRQRALSRWESEGGPDAHPTVEPASVPELTNVELVHLRIRVIALENLMIAVLSHGSRRQLEIAREMASNILPRAGSTPHPLTISAAEHMTNLVNRAVHFRTLDEATAADGI